MVVSISSNNNDHLQRPEHNCLNSVLCVPFINVTIPGRKLADEDIQEIGVFEGESRTVWGLFHFGLKISIYSANRGAVTSTHTLSQTGESKH